MASLRRTLPQCEYSKQRKNLLRVCGMALKSVVDKFCFNGVLDDTDSDVQNLLIILENILMHRCKPKGSVWFTEEVSSYWPCVLNSCSKIRKSCVPSIVGMGSHLTSLGLGRIFLRVALMERRLAEYLSELVSRESTVLLRKVYDPEAFLLKEEGAALPHICLGLNAIDFSFCLKGEDVDYQFIPCIDFTPYLDFTPCAQAELDDEHEQAILSGISRDESSVSSDDTWRAKFQTLYVKYRELGQQKSYCEDMLTLRQARIEKLEHDVASLQGDNERAETEHQREVKQLQGIVAELQSERESVGSGRSSLDRRRLEVFLTGLSRNGKFHEAIALKEISESDRGAILADSQPDGYGDGASPNDDCQRSPYGSVHSGLDDLEQLLPKPYSVESTACNGSLRGLNGSISNSSTHEE